MTIIRLYALLLIGKVFLEKTSIKDQLLRWHFWQAVLKNMKGAGEPVFEHDFPPGSDIVGSILEGPKAAKRMEFELFSRFAGMGLIE